MKKRSIFLKFSNLRFRLYIIVFFSAVFLMIMELVASRIIAPYLGSSVYTWTTIIGVILGGISLGNYLGGRLIDQQPKLKLLGKTLFLTSFLVFSVLPLRLVLSLTYEMPWPFFLKIFFFVFFLFFLPAVSFGAVLPMATRLGLETVRSSGETVGEIYALSSLGSIVGTFLAGFFLISYLGSFESLILCCLGLIGLGFLAVPKKKALFLFLLLIFLIWLLLFSGDQFFYASIYENESNYYLVSIIEKVESGLTRRAMFLDNSFQGSIFLEDLSPADDHLNASLLAFSFFKPKSLLFIGGGPYILPSLVKAQDSGAKVMVVEIDPEVTHMAEKFFGPIDPLIETLNLDGRMALSSYCPHDLIYADAYSSYLSIPFFLTTREFFQKAYHCLAPEGVFIANIISAVEGEMASFSQSYLKTMKEVFPYLVMMPTREASEIQNIIVIGLKERPFFPLEADYKKFPSEVLGFLDKTIFDYKPQKGLLLTDNFAPVERMTLPMVKK